MKRLGWVIPRRCRYCRRRAGIRVEDVGFACDVHVGKALQDREWARMSR